MSQRGDKAVFVNYLVNNGTGSPACFVSSHPRDVRLNCFLNSDKQILCWYFCVIKFMTTIFPIRLLLVQKMMDVALQIQEATHTGC